jgi:hypothetical protein
MKVPRKDVTKTGEFIYAAPYRIARECVAYPMKKDDDGLVAED